MDASEIKVGDLVMVIDARFNSGAPSDVPVTISNPNAPFGRLAMVVAVQDVAKNPGKWIALCLKDKYDRAHSCDGLVPQNHGWWSRPEHLYTPGDHKSHQLAARDWQDKLAAAKRLYANFLGGREPQMITSDDVGELDL